MRVFVIAVLLLSYNSLLQAGVVLLPKGVTHSNSNKNKKSLESFVAAMDRNDFELAGTIVHTMNKSMLNSRVKLQTTPLIMSVAAGSSEMTKAMINRGADINMADIGGATPLHVAVRMNKPDLVKLLVASGAKVSLRDGLGYTPIMRAALRCDLDMISVLTASNANRANLMIKNKKGETAYDLSSHCKDEKVRNMLQIHRIG